MYRPVLIHCHQMTLLYSHQVLSVDSQTRHLTDTGRIINMMASDLESIIHYALCPRSALK